MTNTVNQSQVVPEGTAYSTAPNQIDPDVNSTVHANTTFLGDANYPSSDNLIGGPDRGFATDYWPPDQMPGYAGAPESRTLWDSPGLVQDYTFEIPKEDVGNIPGRAQLNINNGPVSGWAMDGYQTGNHTDIGAQVPGYYGPVGGTSPDYATSVAYANFAQAFEYYSTDASNGAVVAAI